MFIKDLKYTLKNTVKVSKKGQFVTIGPEIKISFTKGHTGYSQAIDIGCQVKEINRNISDRKQEKLLKLMTSTGKTQDELRESFKASDQKEEELIKELQKKEAIENVLSCKEGAVLIKELSNDLQRYLFSNDGTPFDHDAMNQLENEDRHGIIMEIISFFITS